eukprot:scaffold8179_cov430-Prasinococcus_capsulatus_cf.AAC.7
MRPVFPALPTRSVMMPGLGRGLRGQRAPSKPSPKPTGQPEASRRGTFLSRVFGNAARLAQEAMRAMACASGHRHREARHRRQAK